MKLIYRYCLLKLILVMALAFASPAHAHGDEPRLEITPERVNPGGVVEVRGVDFEREEIVALMLVNGYSAVPFGEIVADVDGVFLQSVIVPVDLPAGTYNFLAITDDHNITSPDLTVQGPALMESGEGEDGRRDEEEPLLVPVSTYPPGVVPGVAPGATQAIVPENGDSGANYSVAVMGGIVLVSGVVLFVIRNRKRR